VGYKFGKKLTEGGRSEQKLVRGEVAQNRGNSEKK
jgi:hypothetical protein